MGIGLKRIAIESDWRNETLRTNLWLIPAVESVAAVLLFVLTLSVDHAAFHRQLSLPSWVISGSPDAAREILAALAGALITVVGVVFSVMIVTLTLASQQFGPRMLRTFIRDRGAQFTLGTFVATFFYAMLVLISIGSTFVPHLSVTVALALTALDLGVLIYFIHHTATAIQLPEVIASIARDLTSAIDDECGGAGQPAKLANGPSPELLQARLDRGGAVVAAPTSGYLRFVRHATLVAIAAEYDAVIRLHDRPGHFLTRGHPMATVWPPEVADTIRHRLERVHITGPLRTLTQDIAFGIDQLVEIAIRALSPAVNDPFTAMTASSGTWTIKGIPTGNYGFEFAHSVRVDPQDNIWAVDEGTNMVIKFNPAGRIVMVPPVIAVPTDPRWRGRSAGSRRAIREVASVWPYIT